MASRRSTRTAVVLALAAATATATLASGPARAATSPPPTIESVTRELATLEGQARAAAERQQRAEQAVADGTTRLVDVQREAAATEARLVSSRRTLGRLAAESYRTGALDPALLRVVFADDAGDALHQAASVARVLDRQDAVVDRVGDVRAELAADQEKLQREVADLERNREAAARESRAVQEKTAAAQALLSTLRDEERRRAEQVVSASAVRGAERASRSAERTGFPAASAPAGACPPSGSRGAEAGLTPATLEIMRCGLAAFPSIPSAGGLGSRSGATDHDNGRAVDFMIPNYRTASGNDLGWAVAEWATKQPNVSYVIFDQMIFGGWSGGWTPMENRGSDTANHRDHVHVSVSR